MKALQILEQTTALLLQANVATPIISGVIMSIAGIIKAVTGSGPSPREIAAMLRTQIGRNDEVLNAEIERLEAKLGQQ